MKSKLATIIFCVCLLFSCRKDEETIQIPTYEISQEVIDGISYKCVTVGDQVWMAENLKTRLDGGRADGSMSFDEPIVTLASKESLELKLLVKNKLIKQLNDGFFNTNSTINAAAEYFIYDDLIPYFFNRNTYGWIQYETMNLNRMWDWYYSRPAIDLVRFEVARLFEEEKKLIILAAADQNYIKEHGYLYTFEASQKVIPQGWRIPSDEDWMKLERAMGMSEQDVLKKDEWRGTIGSVLKANPSVDNFNAKLGGAYIYGVSQHSDNFINKDLRGYWWTSTKDETVPADSTYYIRALRFDNDQMLRGTTRLGTAYNIRLVRDK
ncbi:fibrobacter succinogenes major paralogous domain-containing protein [Sphingobacterium bovistauri]|uniref:Fibrobacter succinogenes major paralogous domain-containing protein n=1 Tax=Sphingobacterium bovistauri TaxID=2781959 RepID=A0ABS7Z820_9SPHI|nr:fibrobacter succinogenes major paralogous domain-containing protein [Sphingobacterium bovistauri]MCA5006343.1 fibrobacter succinogenes major paralogous domain-containing protein [Sphingobacterium bovistauri]